MDALAAEAGVIEAKDAIAAPGLMQDRRPSDGRLPRHAPACSPSTATAAGDLMDVLVAEAKVIQVKEAKSGGLSCFPAKVQLGRPDSASQITPHAGSCPLTRGGAAEQKGAASGGVLGWSPANVPPGVECGNRPVAAVLCGRGHAGQSSEWDSGPGAA